MLDKLDKGKCPHYVCPTAYSKSYKFSLDEVFVQIPSLFAVLKVSSNLLKVLVQVLTYGAHSSKIFTSMKLLKNPHPHTPPSFLNFRR